MIVEKSIMLTWLQKIAFDFDDIEHHNQQYQGTGGISAEARDFDLWAAYQHKGTGEIFYDKAIPIHLFRVIPEKYWTKVDDHGYPIGVVNDIVDGFVDLNTGKFLTREQAADVAQKGKSSAT